MVRGREGRPRTETAEPVAPAVDLSRPGNAGTGVAAGKRDFRLWRRRAAGAEDRTVSSCARGLVRRAVVPLGVGAERFPHGPKGRESANSSRPPVPAALDATAGAACSRSGVPLAAGRMVGIDERHPLRRTRRHPVLGSTKCTYKWYCPYI
jgi:hypothetical protein